MTVSEQPPDEDEITRHVDHITDLVLSGATPEQCQEEIIGLARQLGSFDDAACRVVDAVKNRMDASSSRAA